MGALLSLRSDKHSLETNIFVDFESKPSETRKKKTVPVLTVCGPQSPSG